MTTSTAHRHQKLTTEEEIEYLHEQLQNLYEYSSAIGGKVSDLSSTLSQWCLSSQLLNSNYDHLKEEFIRISKLVYEANTMLEEMHQQIVYRVILQISVSYLKPAERSIRNLCLPAVQVKRENSVSQIWDIEKFELQYQRIKSLYMEWIISDNKTELLAREFKRKNPFFDDEFNSFIGVANIYLKSLFHNSKLDYIVPIINTQGEMSGSLHVVMNQTGLPSITQLNQCQIDTITYSSNSDESNINERNIDHISIGRSDESNKQVTIKFSIKKARDLPSSNAEYIMCRYTFINPKLDQTVLSEKSSNTDKEQKRRTFSFDHENEYTFSITDEFLSQCFDSVISIEVWYQHNVKSKFMDITKRSDIDQHTILVREISQQWKDVKRHVQFSVEIHELDSLGKWKPSEVDVNEKIISGGIYRLKQGQSKRLFIKLRLIPRSDPMPLVLHEIRSVEIGSISTRKIQAPYQLDSYQDEDLQYLKEKWLNFIEKRKTYLESQISRVDKELNKTSIEAHRESVLLEELVRIAEERNIASFPPPASGIPGAPASWDPPVTIEMHRPILFLDIDPLSMSPTEQTAGLRTILNEENKTPMFQLPLIQNASDETHAVAQWDPTIHELSTMNQVTPNDTLIYLIVKVTVIISEPAYMELVLRKRIAIALSKPEQSWPEKKLKNFLGDKPQRETSVVYEIISQIPTNLHDMEDRKNIDLKCLSDDYIKKYIQYGAKIDSVLLLDKLRQEVLVAEDTTKQTTIQKATSISNTSNLLQPLTHEQQENLSSSASELNISTPSLMSRIIFIEEEQMTSKPTSTLKIKHSIDLDDNSTNEQVENALEQLSNSLSNLSVESSSSRKLVNNSNDTEELIIGSRVLVNTDHAILNKSGTIRFIGETFIAAGTWYGIELDEPFGKHNGSLKGFTYFQCPDKHGIFVRRDKFKTLN